MRDIVWFACSECFERYPQLPRRGCPVCEGTGQYEALRPPAPWEKPDDPDDRARSLAWVRTIREGHQ